MSGNRQLHEKLRSGRAKFYLSDLHVHSPASPDVRLPQRFENLSEEAKGLLEQIPVSTTNDPVQYEAQAIQLFPPATFLSSIIAQRDEILAGTEAENTDNWALVAITDHNLCKYATELASYAWTQLAENRLIVLPGIELGISYAVPPDGQRASAHLLCIFAPNTSDSDVRIAIHDAGGLDWTPGQGLDLELLPDFVNKLRNHARYPAICIAAHVGSSEGVQNETRKAILSRLDAAISRVQGELETGDEPDGTGTERAAETA
jgi:hypothetical protein